MSVISATGVSVRHAISRSLATANLTPREATFRVLTAQVRADAHGGVVRAEVSIRLRRPEALAALPPEEWVDWVNPDGLHPLMAVVPVGVQPGAARLLFMDVFPVTWDAWLRVVNDALPDRVDPLFPVTGVSLEQAQRFATELGYRLPTSSEFSAAWGDERYPWGHKPDPRLGRVGRPRFDQLPPVGAHPPSSYGLFDLGAWLWHLLDDGSLAGGADEREPGFGLEHSPERGPVGFRCVCDLER
jgi:hypothetical protein